jgi:hypothetical protein
MDRRPEIKPLLFAVAAASLMLLGLRLAVQGGWMPTAPQDATPDELANLPLAITGRMVGVVYQLATRGSLIVAMWLAAAGFGSLLRPRSKAAQCAVGMAVLLQLNWLLAWAGGLNRITAIALITIGVAILAVQLYRRYQPPDVAQWRMPWLALAAAPLLGLYAAAATCPPGTMWKVEAWGYDVLSYHLQLPREWLESGAMSGLHHNVYSYLPSFAETAYMMVGAVHGSMYDGIYTAQLLHVSMTLCAAVCIGTLATRFAGRNAGIIGGAIFLAVPWSVITGTMAYDEMFAMAFVAGSLLIVFGDEANALKRGALAGVCAGAATLSKLTIGAMTAVPIGLILLLGLHRGAKLKAAAAMAVVGLAMLIPWMARNGIDTGNPVFPFTTKMLGRGHWSEDLADRWHRAHEIDDPAGERFAALSYQWLTNTGYGAIFTKPRMLESAERESRNIARFDTERGWPLLWLVAGAGFILCIARRDTRPLGTAMAVMLIWSVVFWLMFTHLQSRFLIPTLLPACVAIGVGLGRPRKAMTQRVAAAAAVLFIAHLSMVGIDQFHRQTYRGTLTYQVIDSLVPIARMEIDPLSGTGNHIINRELSERTRTLIVADNARLLYIRRPFVYNSAFDANPLGDLIRRVGNNPAVVTAALREQGYTHVYVHFSEMARLHATYGFDPAVTADTIVQLAQFGWRPAWADDRGISVLFALPR